MGLFDRLRGRSSQRKSGSSVQSDRDHLANWTRDHVGVEAYVEPQTTVTPMTVVLVAADGEWTRRPVGGPSDARRLGKDLKIPVYDVRKTGYPQRMRDHDARQRILERRRRSTE